MKNVEIQRAPQRALLNQFFNGDPPWTEKEAEDNGILINFNDKQGATLLHQSRNQLENAFSKTGTFWTFRVPDAPADIQDDIGEKITRHINKIMRDDPAWYYTQDCVWGGVVLHGVGAKMWWDGYAPVPSFTGIQDILLSTDTDLTMENCLYIAVRRGMRPGTLFKKTIGAGENANPGWDMEMVRKILKELKGKNTGYSNYDWSNQPEKMVEIYKQNRCYFDADTAPMVWFWDFYHYEEEYKDPNRRGWYRKILLDNDSVPSLVNDDKKNFVFSGKRPFANKLSEIIHFQFGDGNNVPPFKYHSIRSLAWLIYDLVWTMNRLNCQFTQHVFEQLMLLFRVQDPSDRDRLQQLVLQGIVGLIPEGLQMVTADERYQVDNGLISSALSNFKQRIGESSSQYTQNVDTGTQKERTKYEVQAVVSQSSALMASMLGRAYRQEHFAAVEIARRFTIKNSPDFRVKKFLQLCREDGIEDKWLNSDRWDVEVEQVLGSGNRMMELAESTELMNRLNDFDPQAQQVIKHDWVLGITNNPKKANRLAPLKALPQVTDAIHDAELSFGSLMLGVQMNPKEGINHYEQVDTLLKMMQQRIQVIKMTGNVGTPQDIIGLQSVAQYIAKHIQIIAQNPKNKEKVKIYTDALSKMMNEVRAFAQRQAEEAKQNGKHMDPEVIAKIQGEMASLSVKLKGVEAKQQQQLRHKEAKFQQQVRQGAMQTASQIRNETGKALAETAISGMREASKPKPKSPIDE